MTASAISNTVFVLFGSVCFAFASLSITVGFSSSPRISLTGCDTASAQHAKTSMARPLLVLSMISMLGFVLSFVYICEQSSYLQSSGQNQSMDFILFAIGLLFVTSFMTLHPLRSGWEDVHETFDTLLPRSQTLEWKGWMQAILLLFELTESSEAIPFIRLTAVNSFLWLTGFGHAAYHYSTSDYSVRRLLQVMLRVNLLPILIMTILGEKMHVNYPACLLHSLAYLLVYVTMALSRHTSPSSQKSQRHVLNIYFFLLGSSFIVSCARSANEVSVFVQGCHLLLPTLFGVTFASNRNKLVGILKTLHTGTEFHANSRKCVLLLTFCFLSTILWGSRTLFTKRTVLRPVLTVYSPLVYILIRNLTPGFRDHVLTLFSTIGSISLELYVLHRHIVFKSFGVGGLAALFDQYPKMNLLVTGTICCILAKAANVASTAVIRTCLFETQRDVLLQVLLFSFGMFMLCLMLDVSNLLNSFSAVLVVVFSGWTIYRKIIKTGNAQVTTRMHVLAPAACCLIALLLGTCWDSMTSPDGTVKQGLGKNCEQAVLDGSWIQVDTCTDSVMINIDGVSSFGTCQSLQWAWKVGDPKCRFTHRTSDQIRRELRNRSLTFIGDSEIRHLYYAFCRSVGDSYAGAYNTSMEKHSDISHNYDNVLLEFRWAPFVQNLTSTLATVSPGEPSDVIVLGGGAWDRLHHFENEDDQLALRSAVNGLVTVLQAVKEKIPIVWVTPTTINSWALNTEQKRNNIREDQMEAFRELYLEEGIAGSSSFLFHGPAYTKDRVDECYDGVHYPQSVYDGGTQILANAMDWLLADGREMSHEESSSPTSPQLLLLDIDFYEAVLLLICLCLGLFVHDDFCGTIYLASIFLPSLRPYNTMHLKGQETQQEGKDSDEESKAYST